MFTTGVHTAHGSHMRRYHSYKHSRPLRTTHALSDGGAQGQAHGVILMKSYRALAASCMLAAALILEAPQAAVAGAPSPGEGVFNLSCAACHKGGGNIVQAGATLSKADMQRNGLLDVDAVYQVVYSGKGKMYGFGQNCTPKGKCTFGMRLSDSEVAEVAQFVWDKSNQGW